MGAKPTRVTSWETTQQIIRIVLQIIAGAMVSRGMMDQGLVTEFVGAGISIVSLIWWAVFDHRRKVLVAEGKAAVQARQDALMSQ